jgi:hypothetical protein
LKGLENQNLKDPNNDKRLQVEVARQDPVRFAELYENNFETRLRRRGTSRGKTAKTRYSSHRRTERDPVAESGVAGESARGKHPALARDMAVAPGVARIAWAEESLRHAQSMILTWIIRKRLHAKYRGKVLLWASLAQE